MGQFHQQKHIFYHFEEFEVFYTERNIEEQMISETNWS